MTSHTTYFDNAATGFPKPEVVYQAVDSYQRQVGAAFGRGTYGSDHADSVVARCRHQLAQLIGATDHDSVSFTFNATDGLNLLLRGILRRGDHVLTTTLEHNSVLRPLQQLRDLLQITVDFVSFDINTGLIDSHQFAQMCHARLPRLVVLNMVSNVTGIVQSLSELIPVARAAGAIVLVDASQAAGHVSVDVSALDIDLLAAPGHKGLGGPLGTGFVYVSPSIQARLISCRCGGTGTESASLQQPSRMPGLLESGNLNMPGIAGLNAALTWRNTEQYENLSQRYQRHIGELIHHLSKIYGVTVCCRESAARRTGVVSFYIDQAQPHEVALTLSDSFGIHCRAGLHCAPLTHRTLGTEPLGGTVRLSPGLFTTDEEINHAVRAVSEIATVY